MCTVVYSISLLLSFNIYGVCSDKTSFIPDTGNLSLLLFPFVSLTKGLSIAF